MNKEKLFVALFVALAIIGSGYAGLTMNSWNPYTKALDASTEAYGKEIMAGKEAQMDYFLSQKKVKKTAPVCQIAQIDTQRGTVKAITAPFIDECLHSQNEQGL